MIKTFSEKAMEATKEKPCNHFMVWHTQKGYAYYRCDKCNYIDGKKTFAAQKQEIVEEIEEDYIRWVLAGNIKDYNRKTKWWELKDKAEARAMKNWD